MCVTKTFFTLSSHHKSWNTTCTEAACEELWVFLLSPAQRQTSNIWCQTQPELMWTHKHIRQIQYVNASSTQKLQYTVYTHTSIHKHRKHTSCERSQVHSPLKKKQGTNVMHTVARVPADSSPTKTLFMLLPINNIYTHTHTHTVQLNLQSMLALFCDICYISFMVMASCLVALQQRKLGERPGPRQ